MIEHEKSRPFAVWVTGATHVGVVRAENQDCLHLDGWSAQQSGARLSMELGPGGIVAVIDGMGGHVGGALASWTSASALSGVGLSSAREPADVDRSLQLVADAVRERGSMTEGHASMGATIAGFVVTATGLLLFNVGDCSILRIRDGYVGQLALIDRSGPGGLLSQCLGGSPQPMAVDAHATLFQPEGAERLLLCSDGLTDCVANEQIAALAAPEISADDAVRALISAAVHNGAPDNVSVIVIDVTPEQAELEARES